MNTINKMPSFIYGYGVILFSGRRRHYSVRWLNQSKQKIDEGAIHMATQSEVTSGSGCNNIQVRLGQHVTFSAKFDISKSSSEGQFLHQRSQSHSPRWLFQTCNPCKPALPDCRKAFCGADGNSWIMAVNFYDLSISIHITFYHYQNNVTISPFVQVIHYRHQHEMDYQQWDSTQSQKTASNYWPKQTPWSIIWQDNEKLQFTVSVVWITMYSKCRFDLAEFNQLSDVNY